MLNLRSGGRHAAVECVQVAAECSAAFTTCEWPCDASSNNTLQFSVMVGSSLSQDACTHAPLPPLLCHGANMSRHISVRICLFLPPASSYKAPPQSTRAACLSLKYWNVFTCYIL